MQATDIPIDQEFQNAVDSNFSFFNSSTSIFGVNVPNWYFILIGMGFVMYLSLGGHRRRY